MNDVVVIGGGFGGLLVAAEIKRRGGDPVLLEATEAAGGVARSVREDGYLLEPAAGSILLPNAHLSPILEAAGAAMLPAAEDARRRYVYRGGELHPIVESPALVASPIVSWRGKLRALREPWIKTPPPGDDESLLSFFVRRFGAEMGELGATLMAHGVFAADPAELSIRGAFPRMAALEDRAGSMVRGGIAAMKARPKGTPRAGVHVPPHGMAGIVDALVAYLGAGYRGGVSVKAVEPRDGGWVVQAAEDFAAKHVVVALAPHAAAPLLPTAPAAVVAEGEASPVAVVGLGGRAAELPLPSGFGALVGPDEDVRALGVLFESEYAPDRAPELHRVAKGIYGGGADPGALEMSDAELVAEMRRDVSKLIGVDVFPSWTRVVRHHPGIPQYPVGHPAWLERIDHALGEQPGLHLAGWGYRGIGVTSLAADAVRIADVIGV